VTADRAVLAVYACRQWPSPLARPESVRWSSQRARGRRRRPSRARRRLIVRLGGAGYPPITGSWSRWPVAGPYAPTDRVSDIAPRTRGAEHAKPGSRALRAASRGGAASRRTCSPPADQRRRAAARARQRDRAGTGGGLVARRRRRASVPRRPARGCCPRSPVSASARVVPGLGRVEPFVGHVPSVRLRVPHPKPPALHPAQIADLVEAASHRGRRDHAGRRRGRRGVSKADVFEELDDQQPDGVPRAAPGCRARRGLAAHGADDARPTFGLSSATSVARREARLRTRAGDPAGLTDARAAGA